MKRHLARMPMGNVCFGALRTGGLWPNITLRALGAPGGHLRPGPGKRLDNATNALDFTKRVVDPFGRRPDEMAHLRGGHGPADTRW